MVTFDDKGITFDCEDIKARVEIDASEMLAQLRELTQQLQPLTG